MLIEKNVKNKRNSWYICDMCGEKLTGITRHLVEIDRIKEVDLCKLCVKRIKAYIERGKK